MDLLAMRGIGDYILLVPILALSYGLIDLNFMVTTDRMQTVSNEKKTHSGTLELKRRILRDFGSLLFGVLGIGAYLLLEHSF